MKIQILIEETLRYVHDGVTGAHRFAFEYEDSTSQTIFDALARCWTITNGAIMRLSEDDLELRLKWEELHPGLSVSVGDIVVVDGRPYECKADGWGPASIKQ